MDAPPFDARVRLDAWEPEYGPEVAFDAETAPTGDAVLDVERSAWEPVIPGAVPPGSLAFVDGVRRLEARLVVPTAGGIAHGLLGSCAAGVVRAGEGAATFGPSLTLRLMITGGGVLGRHGRIHDDLEFEPRAVVATDRDAPVTAFHTAMRVLEGELARELLLGGETAILDGPLTFDAGAPAGGVGLIKRLTDLHLPVRGAGDGASSGEAFELLERLPVGARTPVFALSSGGRFGRYAWFVRLSDPPLAMTRLGGVVRMEVLEGVGLERAVELADLTAGRLPAFASSMARDARAPSNLLPVGALEARLRHGLGDPELIRRRIQAAFGRWARSPGR